MPRSRPCRRGRRRRPPGTRRRRGRARPSTPRGRRGASPRGRAGPPRARACRSKVAHRMRARPLGVLGDVVVEARVAVGQRALGVREDAGTVDVGERAQRRVAVGREEVVPRPGREVDDLAAQVLRGHEPAGRDRRRARRGRPRSSTRRGSRPRPPRRRPPRGRGARPPRARSPMPRVSMRCPVGPPMPGCVRARRCRRRDRRSMYMRGTPNRLPASAARAAAASGAPEASAGRSATYEAGRTSDDRGIETHGCTRQKSPRVSASSATMTSSTSSRSAMVRVCGTTTSIVGTSGQLPRTEMTPREGV